MATIKKLLFPTPYDPASMSAWSGTSAYLLAALKSAVPEVVATALRDNPWLHVRETIRNRLGLGYRHFDHAHAQAKYLAAQVDRLVRQIQPDVVLSTSSIPLAYARPGVPMFCYTDATYAAMIGYYPGFGENTRETRSGNAVELQALRKCAHVFYASEWAKDSAVRNYGADARRLTVVPFGANLDGAPTEAAVNEAIASRSKDWLNLLLVGRDWDRKGGEVAAQAAALLHKGGVRVTLRVVGASVPTQWRDQEFVEVEDRIDKRLPADVERLHRLYSQAHFLILPTQAECFGIVFSEASAHGVPSLAGKTGGVPTAVREGRNGLLFDLPASPGAIAEAVRNLFHDYSAYIALANSSREEYRNRLNWTTAANELVRVMEACS